jgi:hypothetical protein
LEELSKLKWRIVKVEEGYLICRKTWKSEEWMGIEKADIRTIAIRDRQHNVEVFAECSTLVLAKKLLPLAAAH